MDLKEKDIEFIISKVQPKISASLSQTSPNYKDDLEQDLKEMIIRKIKEGRIDNNVPGFFEYLNRKKQGHYSSCFSFLALLDLKLVK
ncbi:MULTISPECIES: hypothetical protein [Sporosarcina]|uniref:Uncharacterized protein n=1 Tax=Sporosarcina contaminans TaxID=633403 RepID=A0ABW3TXQ9_9BACL